MDGFNILRTGSVTAIQRFGGALNLNVHLHSIIPDGVWTEAADGALTFHRLPAPKDDELETLTATIERRIHRHLVRRGLWYDDEDGGRPADPDELPPLAGITYASVTQRRQSGAPLRRVGTLMPLEAGTLTGAKRRRQGSFDLHAKVVVRATDRERLEHLCRYLLRPPLASDRLEELADGDLLLRLKTRWSDGTTHLRLTPQELLGRLAALIPRPRVNMLLYHGVLGARARWRSRIVPAASPTTAAPGPTSRVNHTWAELMRRGLDINSLECPHQCGEGRLRFIATIERPPVARAILAHLGLPAVPIHPAPARAPPTNMDIDWDI